MKQILDVTLPQKKLKFNLFYFLCLSSIVYCVYYRENFFNRQKNWNSMDFTKVAQAFEKIGHVSSRIEITKILAELLHDTSADESEIICNLSLGLVRPSYQGGTQFNMAEKSLLKVVALLLESSQEEIEQKAKSLGDLGLVIATKNWTPEKKLSVIDVYTKLLHLEKLSGAGSQEERSLFTLALLRDLDSLSAQYVVRIILGKLRLGFSDMTLIDALSWMETGDKSLHKKIEEAYNLCADIGYIAKTIKVDGIAGIEKLQCKLGIPIRMAAAERLPTAEAIFERVGASIAQPKLDGFRLQIHLDKTDLLNPVVHFFSRNLIDMSEMFPDLVTEFLQLPVKTMICEGEAIVYDPNTGSFVPFQETVKRKRKHGIEEAVTEFPLQLYVFDILYLNGKELINETHHERRDRLLEILKNYQGSVIHVIPEVSINSAQELKDYFLKNIDSGLEGIMVKKDNSVYQAGKRNFNWIKFKRMVNSHVEDTIDCVVLGYYQGKGRRSSLGIGAFLVGIYNPHRDCFQTIAKIGTGLKDDGWKELKKKSDALAVDHKPNNVECPKELYPDVWVAPEIVCSILADEITLSPLHTAAKTETSLGYALRFPRFIDYVLDKKAEQSTTPEEIKEMYNDQFKVS